ncbi:MAG: site-specific DNA-methyltransferase, partial [Caldilineaceae bacterium]
EDVNYPTQKTTGLLRRIIQTATNPGDLVLDAFVGSGTTVAVAEELGRRWIGCDANWRAIRTSQLRVMGGEIWRVGDEQVAGGQGEGVTGRAEAQICVAWEDDRLLVEICSFRSPAVEGLISQAGVELPTDWRATVQAVLIDPAYDGVVFRAGLVDAPKDKTALVAGVYTLPPGRTALPVAVRLVDVAGGELLVVVGTDAIIRE